MAQADFLTVNMSEALRAKLDSYCQAWVTDPSDLIDHLLADYLTREEQQTQSLAAGYQAMASLNAEICSEFSACECEAYDQIS